MSITVQLVGNMAFEAHTPSGSKFVLDAYPESGGEGHGPTPVEALLSSAAACSGMDVISILRKKRQQVTGYRIVVETERSVPEGQYPRPFSKIVIRHELEGDNLDAAAVARAVELSDEKYCTVVATLRAAPEVVSEWTARQTQRA